LQLAKICFVYSIDIVANHCLYSVSCTPDLYPIFNPYHLGKDILGTILRSTVRSGSRHQKMLVSSTIDNQNVF